MFNFKHLFNNNPIIAYFDTVIIAIFRFLQIKNLNINKTINKK